jgi:hypothetical protein
MGYAEREKKFSTLEKKIIERKGRDKSALHSTYDRKIYKIQKLNNLPSINTNDVTTNRIQKSLT